MERSSYYLVAIRDDSNDHFSICDEASAIKFPYIAKNLDHINPLTFGLKPNEKYSSTNLRKRVEEAQRIPELVVYTDYLGGISEYLGLFEDVGTIEAHLRKLYILPYGDLNHKIYFSLANYIKLKNAGEAFISLALQENHTKEIRGDMGILELNRMRLALPTGKGFCWRLVNNIKVKDVDGKDKDVGIRPFDLEKNLMDYEEMTNIPIQDAIDAIKSSRTKEISQIEKDQWAKALKESQAAQMRYEGFEPEGTVRESEQETEE